MNKQELLVEIEETLQREEPLLEDMQLSDIEEWDSLAIISMVSLYDQLFKTVVTHDDLKSCNSIEDLLNLVKDKLD